MRVFLFSLFLVIGVYSLNAQIVFNGSVTKSGSGVGSLTQSKTIPAGNNRLIYVGITIQQKNITSVTWNGLALTQFTVGTRAGMSVAIYYRALGSSATPTTANVVATFSGGTDAFMGIGDYTGVYQTAPFASPTIAQAKSTKPSITFASSIGNLAVSLLGDIAATPTANGAVQTQYWSYTGSHSNRSTSKPGAISVTMTHTISASEDWVLIGGTMQDNAVMPIELVDFSADLTFNNKVSFKWQTATETNNNYFEIERSKDGINFYPLNKVKSKAENGNSLKALNYEASDLEPLTEISYYRLKQVDFSGEFSFSKIISLNKANNQTISFIIFPNPNNGEFYVNTNGIENNHTVEVTVFNNQSLIYNAQTDINSLNNKLFNLKLQNDLKPGLYQVLFIMEGIKYNCSLVIQ